MRIDKFLWCIRLFKTRTEAAKACDSEKVKLNSTISKSSRIVKVNDTILLKENPIWRSYKIVEIPKSRLGAKLVRDFIIEITSEEDLATLQQVQLENRNNHLMGIKGRPTKKDRRNIHKFTGI